MSRGRTCSVRGFSKVSVRAPVKAATPWRAVSSVQLGFRRARHLGPRADSHLVSPFEQSGLSWKLPFRLPARQSGPKGSELVQYLGGKSRIAKALAAEIAKVRKPGQLAWDAFCGGLSMSVALAKHGPVLSTDACLPLISLYKAVQAGWRPPSEVSREQYESAKQLPAEDPMKAFCGFGCSFGGKWFGGYAAGFNGPLTYTQLAARNVLRNVRACTQFACASFLDVPVQQTPALIYCDPPYAGTTGYAATGAFDTREFIRRVQKWSTYTDVFVSEYTFPVGRMVWERASTGTLSARTGGIPHVERLFYVAKGSLG